MHLPCLLYFSNETTVDDLMTLTATLALKMAFSDFVAPGANILWVILFKNPNTKWTPKVDKILILHGRLYFTYWSSNCDRIVSLKIVNDVLYCWQTFLWSEQHLMVTRSQVCCNLEYRRPLESKASYRYDSINFIISKIDFEHIFRMAQR